MTNDLTPTHPGELAPRPADVLALAGQIANQAAQESAFADYQGRIAYNTKRRQANDLALFRDYLQAAGLPVTGDYMTDPAAWRGVTWGIVAGFVKWLLREGYAIGSINQALTSVKRYARLAAQAGQLDPGELPLIHAVEGYRRSEAVHIDETRTVTRRSTRRTGTAARKKQTSVSLSASQAAELKAQPDTPQGRRDRLMMCLLLDHGLRVGEVARLVVGDFDLKAGELRFYRPKVDKTQTHRLTADTAAAARAYLATDAPALGQIWRGSHKGKGSQHGQPGGGVLTADGMSARAITQRVTDLGAALGIVGLSAHDCRHYAATRYARRVNAGKLTFKDFIDLFGWSSPAMALRYIESAQVIDVESWANGE